jgi:hypothetical protein
VKIAWDHTNALAEILWGCFSGYSAWLAAKNELDIRPVAEIGPFQVGVCTWSICAKGERDICQAVAYVGILIEGKLSEILATEATTTDTTKLYKSVLVPLPKECWWHRRRYRQEHQKVGLTVEEALLEAHKWAELKIGLTDQQQELIEVHTESVRLRNLAVKELELINGPNR